MTYIALLRGINVGGARKIGMKDLKCTFERLGLEDVRTFIASGNVVFRSGASKPALEKQIESALKKDFAFPVKILLRTDKEIRELVKEIPASWVNNEKVKCDVMFLWKEIDKPKIIKEFPWDPKIEDLRYVPGAVLWRIERRVAAKSKIFRRVIGTRLHQQMTVRNPNTVRKLDALMHQSVTGR